MVNFIVHFGRALQLKCSHFCSQTGLWKCPETRGRFGQWVVDEEKKNLGEDCQLIYLELALGKQESPWCE